MTEQSFSEDFNRRRSEEECTDLVKRIEAKYAPIKEDSVRKYIDDIIRLVKVKFGDAEHIRGKRILDLGCGSTLFSDEKERLLYIQGIEDKDERRRRISDWNTSASYSNELDVSLNPVAPSRLWEPWLCRVLLEIGAEPVGVDIRNLNDEQFEHHQLDLSRAGVLNVSPDHSFDFIHAKQILTALAYRSHDVRPIKDELQRQAQRLLKVGGRIINIGITGGLDEAV